MPRRTATVVENSFVQGYLTERTALNYPANSVHSGANCWFDEKGIASARRAFDVEANFTTSEEVVEDDAKLKAFLWKGVGGDGDTDIVVTQDGKILRFYDASSSTNLSQSKFLDEIDMNNFVVSASPLRPNDYHCEFAVVDGDLIVVNRGIDPFYVEFNNASISFSATKIDVRIRDFRGLLTTRALNERPVSASEVTLRTDDAIHYYNLLNQGWRNNDALTQWMAARGDAPSNADYPSLFRGSNTDSFNASTVTASSPGKAPAAKGHFIVNPFNVDHRTVLLDDGFFAITLDTSTLGITSEEMSSFTFSPSVHWANLNGAFDGQLVKSNSHPNLSKFNDGFGDNSPHLGRRLVTPSVIHSARITGTTDSGYVRSNAHTVSNNPVVFSPEQDAQPFITAVLYAKVGATAPTSDTDGVALGSISFTDAVNESNPRIITSANTTTEYDWVWIRFVTSLNEPIGGISVANWRIGQIQFFTLGAGTTVDETDERPQAVASYAGRVWYSGVQERTFNGKIYFSQIVDNTEEYGKCYQKNDPTSETNADLLPDDGGVISIPEAGRVVKLVPVLNSLVVFTTSGVWAISGAESAFTANNFAVTKVSGLGTNSPNSFALVEGVPYFWGEEGVYRIGLQGNNPIAASLVVENLTETTIKSYINSIPSENKVNVHGAYDNQKNEVVWVYNEGVVSRQDRLYNSITFNTVSNAWYVPSTIDSTSLPRIVGVVGLRDSNFEGTDRIKFFVTYDSTTAGNQHHTFGDQSQVQYADWLTHSISVNGDESTKKTYTPTFTTGYRVDGEANKYFQSNYVNVLMNTLSDSSCFLQGKFDFSNSGNSGKWSRPQQCYNSTITNRDVSQRRLKVRGEGRALQLAFEGEAEKPFEIIGWAIQESGNANV
jgi:hypothetical protein